MYEPRLPNPPQYIGYEDERDAVFVLGAGASFADSVPLQAHILEKIFNSTDQSLQESESAIAIRKFITSNFHISKETYPSLESVFGYLDHFIVRNENLSAEYTTSRLVEIKNAFIQIVHYVIASPEGYISETYKRFWELIGNKNRNVSVISMNYDTLADEAFDGLYQKSTYIDYCIDLMNYHDYDRLPAFNWWINPREPVQTWSDEVPKSIKLLKMHGSLSWKYCPCCGQVLLTPWDSKIDLNTMGFMHYEYGNCADPETKVSELLCPIDGSRFNTLIIPPTHLKELTHPTITRLLDEVAFEIRKAKTIVFIGYSFPESDVHIKALFRKNLQRGSTVKVVDPAMNCALKSNYRSLGAEVRFYESTFGDFIDKDLAETLSQP